jgi:subtilisin family serine protease
VRRLFLVVLLISGLLLVAFVPLRNIGYILSAGVDSPSGYVPTIYVSRDFDKNGNGIEDVLEEEIGREIGEGNGTKLVKVVVLLNVTPTSVHTSFFLRNNGTVTSEIWQHALTGFGGRIPYTSIAKFASECPDLLLVQEDHEYKALMAYAAQQGRARPYVWSVLGLRGDPLSSIAISDTGIDDTHPNHAGYGDADFSKKIVGWRDDVKMATTPYDDNGHGSHVAGIAAGSGFYSSDADGRAVTTWSASLGSLSGSYIYLITGFNVSQSGSGHQITLQAKASGVDTLYLYYSGFTGNPSQQSVATYSMPVRNQEYTFNYSIPDGTIGYYHLWIHGSGTAYLRVTIHWPYSIPNDGYPVWTGVANGAKLVGLKGLDYSGNGSTTNLVNGLNWAVANREKYHILVLSMSWGGGSYDAAIDNAVSNAVGSGIVCVAAAGNSGSGGNYVHSPGSNSYAITVAATSIMDNITSFSSQGGQSEAVSSVVKPDVAAPGGSFYYLPVFSTDSNDQDAENFYTDFYANDSAPMQGTSMSTPFIAGSAAVVAQALGGYAGWNFSGSAKALMVKMLLLMTATETYPFVREAGGVSTSPTLDRGGKDVHEGYGRVNLDAAVEAVALTSRCGDVVTGSFGASPLDRKCWARNFYLYKGTEYKFNLTVPAGADYDLYLYNTTGNVYGEPVILAKSTQAIVGGFENITYTPSLSGTFYVVVKSAREDTGVGQFTLTSSPRQGVHLLLTVEPDQATYVRGQSVTFVVNAFNRLNPPLESILTLTVSGPSGYYFYDFQSISVAVDVVREYSFNWVVPDVAGTYVVEVSLVPSMLTAYDAVWLGAA